MSLNCWLLPPSGWLIFLPQWAPFQKNLNLEAKTDTLSALGWKEECQWETTDGGWHQVLETSCFMPRSPRMNWQCPSQQILLACFPTVTPVRDLDYLAASTVAQPGCQPCGIKHATRTPSPLTPSAVCILYLPLCKIIASGLQVKIHLLAVLFHCCPAVWFSVNLFPPLSFHFPGSDCKLFGAGCLFQYEAAQCGVQERTQFWAKSSGNEANTDSKLFSSQQVYILHLITHCTIIPVIPKSQLSEDSQWNSLALALSAGW